MNSFFMQMGNLYSLTSHENVQIHKTLPRGVYTVVFDPSRGFFLVPKGDVRPLPPKVYGTIVGRAERIARTYRERRERGLSTGVLLAGEKGSGKTLLARQLMDVVDVPTVVVPAAYTGESFTELLINGGPKMVLFDEFEKTYDKDKQTSLLSMLDGHHDNRNLIVATLNDRYAVIDPMQNRPSRFYYYYRYVGIDHTFIEEYCKDRLAKFDLKRLREIQAIASRVIGFNFDMLQSLVEEVNRYDESPEECMRHMNITEGSRGMTYAVKIIDTDTKEEIKTKYDTVQVMNAFNKDSISFTVALAEQVGPGDDKLETLYINGSAMAADNGDVMIFETEWYEQKFTVTIKPQFRNTNWAL